MKKIVPIEYQRVWGSELVLNSQLADELTFFDDGQPCFEGPVIKIIKTRLPTSIHVHPDDEMAQIVSNHPCGVNKSWFVLEAKRTAKVILGLRSYDLKLVRRKLKKRKFGELFTERIVKPGDFLNIPAGLVHGIGPGIKVLEVSTPSTACYEYYSFRRRAIREKELEFALDATKEVSSSLRPFSRVPLTYKNQVGIQIHSTVVRHISKKSIVVDLETYIAYLCEDELIDFDDYVVLPIKN